ELREGYLANIVVLRKDRWRYSTRYSKVTQTPLDGFPLDASVHATIVEGKVSYLEGQVYPVRGSNVFDKTGRS
ncbi:MAG: dihydroorotase, partial [Metallosphaera sp.]